MRSSGPGCVTLDTPELKHAAAVGAARHVAAIVRGHRDQHGAELGGWSIHIEGACGELAASKALGRVWPAFVNTYRSPQGDLGDGIEVRTRSRHDYELIVRVADPDRPFVLVTGIAPFFRVHGWIMGGEAKRPEWLKPHGGREPAYFVPHEALRPMDELSGKSAASTTGGSTCP